MTRCVDWLMECIMAMAELMPLSERSTAAATVSFPIGRKGARCSSCTSLNSDTSCCACTSETSWFRTSSREDACMGSGTEEPSAAMNGSSGVTLSRMSFTEQPAANIMQWKI